MFVAADALAAAIALAVAGPSTRVAMVFLAAVIAADLSDRRRAHQLGMSALDDLPSLTVRAVIIGSTASVLGLPADGSQMPGLQPVLHLVFAPTLFVAFAAILRTVGYTVLRRLQANGRLAGPALIIGAGAVGAQIGRRLADHPEYGLSPVGYVDSSTRDASDLPQPVLGAVEDLPRLIHEHGIRHVFVAFGGVSDEDLVDLLRRCDRLSCEIFVVPRLFELGVGYSSSGEHLWGLPLVRLPRAPFRSLMWAIKRALDAALSAIGLVLGAPLMLAIALAVRLESGPGVLFRQERIGLDGRPFLLIKFRSIQPAASDEPDTWSEVSPERVGPVGRFLRRSSLDELPQLWNVLRGEMSLVGPRPEQPLYVGQFRRVHRRYGHRLRVPAGLTGLSQVHDLRGPTSIEDRVAIDNFYIEHWSLWLDVKILFRTVAAVVRMRGH